jgi:hypothetical protein
LRGLSRGVCVGSLGAITEGIGKQKNIFKKYVKNSDSFFQKNRNGSLKKKLKKQRMAAK